MKTFRFGISAEASTIFRASGDSGSRVSSGSGVLGPSPPSSSASPSSVPIACAGGLAVSSDRGNTWTLRNDALEAHYSPAVAVCGDAVLLSASNGPRGGRGALYRGIAGGDLERCRTGPEWFDDNLDSYCMDALPQGFFAPFGTSDGRVFAFEDTGASWIELISGLPPVQRILVMS